MCHACYRGRQHLCFGFVLAQWRVTEPQDSQSHGHKICSYVFTPNIQPLREEPTCKLCGFTFDVPFFLFSLLNVLYPLHPVGDFSQLERMGVGRGWSLCLADGEVVTISHCIQCMNRLKITKAPTVTPHRSSQLSRSALNDACCQARTPLLNPYLRASWAQSLLLTSHRTSATPPIFFILFKLNGISQHNIIWLLK